MTPEQRAREVLAAAYEALSLHGVAERIRDNEIESSERGLPPHDILKVMHAFAAHAQAASVEDCARLAQILAEVMYETAKGADEPQRCALNAASAFACEKIATTIRALNPPLDAAP